MKYGIERIDISEHASLYAKSLALRLKFIEANIGTKPKEEWFNNYEKIVNEIDYDNMDYGEQEQIDKLLERIDYKAFVEYGDGGLYQWNMIFNG